MNIFLGLLIPFLGTAAGLSVMTAPEVTLEQKQKVNCNEI